MRESSRLTRTCTWLKFISNAQMTGVKRSACSGLPTIGPIVQAKASGDLSPAHAGACSLHAMTPSAFVPDEIPESTYGAWDTESQTFAI